MADFEQLTDGAWTRGPGILQAWVQIQGAGAAPAGLFGI
jgi:hypothetical protein